jgi:hypothetical protein
MLRTERIPDGVELACGRLDELVRLAGPELGRWMIEVAGRYAAGSCRRRTLTAVGGRKPPAAHRLPSTGVRR